MLSSLCKKLFEYRTIRILFTRQKRIDYDIEYQYYLLFMLFSDDRWSQPNRNLKNVHLLPSLHKKTFRMTLHFSFLLKSGAVRMPKKKPGVVFVKICLLNTIYGCFFVAIFIKKKYGHQKKIWSSNHKIWSSNHKIWSSGMPDEHIFIHRACLMNENAFTGHARWIHFCSSKIYYIY